MDMDWSQRFEDMMKAWTDAQQKAWDGFFEAVGTVPGAGAAPGEKAWQQTLAMGEDLLRSMLKAQADTVAMWVDSLSTLEGMPAQGVESAKQFQEMYQRWLKTQEQLLENWLGMLRKYTPAQPAASWADTPQSMFRAWQSATQNIMQAQMDWMQAWMRQAKR